MDLTKTFTIEVLAPISDKYSNILTKEALDFIAKLHLHFNSRRLDLIEERKKHQIEIDEGNFPCFPEATENIRNSDWLVAPIPKDLLDRRVEITGPVDRKMVINALNSGAKVFMADFEDSHAPSWLNTINGQQNLFDAVRKEITFMHPVKGEYKLNKEVATLMVRPRGLHMIDKNIHINGEPISASLFDFGLYFFHNVQALLEIDSGPYFYLPKLEDYHEARWWNEVFVFAQDSLNIPQKTIKATVLIETILASFQLDEILYELKDHSSGLNCGRWDYIFSYIKKFRNYSDFILPDRDQVNMTVPFMEAYSLKVIQSCHKRGVHAMGGMAAQIPVKNNQEANNLAFNKVKNDKEREVKNGHDGTWVAHPGLVDLATEVFNNHMKTPNQINVKRDDINIREEDLLKVPEGTISELGVRKNINVGILYIESWLMGNGAAAIYNLMEDAATAEISRTQLWQWIKHGAEMEDGRVINKPIFDQFLNEEIKKIKTYLGQNRFEKGRFDLAINLFRDLVLSNNYKEFLTTDAYNFI